MVMEAQELVMGSKEIMKGKRTKRQRPMSPLRLAVTSSSSSGVGGGGSEQQQERIIDNSSVEFAESTIGGGREEEEAEMANCLILLAQGNTRKILPKSSFPSKASPESYIYQCKTCNKCFSSFQALGGHRASHNKPNNNNKISNYEEMKKVIIEDQEQDHVINNNMNTTLSLQIPNSNNSNNNNVKSNNRVHVCSICGAEFSSGQALGGHMRRHRAAFASTNAITSSSSSPPKFQESKKPRNNLQLDLNLPAPEDDLRDSKFHFGSKEQVLVFSASSLVDCHY